MKPAAPGTLVQIHYHNRPGGVNTVIGLYARAFAALFTRPAGNYVVCGIDSEKGVSFGPAEVRSMPACGYRDFKKKSVYLRTKALLTESLQRIIGCSGLPQPIYVVGHNLTLGKNCALSAAFAECARMYEHAAEQTLFFSVIHDFAEEGRSDRLSQIRQLRQWGIAIWNDLYPMSGNVRYITPGPRNYTLLKDARFDVRLLPNPVAEPGLGKHRGPVTKRAKLEKLRQYAKEDRAYMNPGLPIVFYPSRVVSRKNILEAVLLSNFVLRTNLLVGGSGASDADRAAGKKVRALCSRYQVPVVFDCERAFLKGKPINGFPEELYLAADACISTSIAEGFGYAFYGPWLHTKALIGRRPVGFSPAAKVRFPFLYDRLPIPADWISISSLCLRYYAAMRASFGTDIHAKLLADYSFFRHAFELHFIQNGTIDFGCLDFKTQLIIAEKLMQSHDSLREWETVCQWELSAIREAFNGIATDEILIRYNQKQIENHLSLKSFEKSFGRCLSGKQVLFSAKRSRAKITRAFCGFSSFRLLLTPE